MQKYKDEYSKQYSCTVKSSKSDKHAFCTIWMYLYLVFSLILELCSLLNFAGWHSSAGVWSHQGLTK